MTLNPSATLQMLTQQPTQTVDHPGYLGSQPAQNFSSTYKESKTQ